MRRFTHLARTFSLAFPAHRLLLVLMALGAVAGWVRPAGDRPATAMFQAAATTAVAWMLARELDPDGIVLALVGAAAAGAVAAMTGATDVAAMASLMLAGRILVRSTGLIPLPTDIVAVGLFAGVFARTPLGWAAGLAVASAIALDTNHSDPSPMRHTWLAAAVGLAVTISAVFSDALDLLWSPPGTASIAVALVATALLLSAPRQPVTSNDAGDRFGPGRVRATRLLAASATALGTLVGGGAHARSTWPIWVALVAAGLGARLRR